MPAAISWNKIYVVDSAGVANVDVPLKDIHPDATLNDYTFHVYYVYLNHDGGSYNNGFRQEFLCTTTGGTLAIGGYPATSTERFGSSSTSITCSESVVSNQLRISVSINSGGAAKGRLFVRVLGTGDPTP